MLDRPSSFTTTSRQLVIGSLRRFADQCREGYAGGRRVRFPSTVRSIRQVVVAGMGGSTLGSDLVRSVFASSMRVPFSIVNGYELPASVDRHTLVVLSSYSGTTEETLAAGRDALRRRAFVTGLAVGGPLGRLLDRAGAPWYTIVPAHNPSGQPRMGLGYNAMGQIGLLTSAGVLRVQPREAEAVVAAVRRRARACDPETPTRRNPAKQLARQLVGRLPVLVSSQHLVGSMHAFANQLNETAKAYAVPFALPELNHHLLEGLRFPAAVRSMAAVVARSSAYAPRVEVRATITSRIFDRQGARVVALPVKGATPLEEAFDLLTVGSAASFYLSVLNHVDPLKIPTVDELKRRLAAA